MAKLLIVADDFTGALDTGVQFAARGARTNVVTDPDCDFAGADAEVLVLDAETRHLPPREAYARVRGVVSRARDIPYIYKKTDSALRGNIGGELAAAMDTLGARRLPFIPAFPSMGRVTRGGVHFIDGVPVAESVFGKDPFEPVTASDVREIIAQQTDRAVSVRAPGQAGEGEGIQVYDAETDEDLRAIGRALGVEGLRLSAGCAGFAPVLADMLGLRGETPKVPDLPRSLFLICGSVNPVTREQVARAEGCGFRRFFLGAGPSPAALLAAGGRVILDANEGINPPADGDPAKVADALASRGRELLDAGLDATLMCVGGDTLMALTRAVGVGSLIPVCEMAPGVVLTCFVYNQRTYYIITKSGGFGDPDLLCRLAGRIGA